MRDLPPGPREPAALQTVEWIVRPTALLRRAQARYGEPFTLRTAWSDAPLVLTRDPAEIKRIYAAPPDVLQAGDSSAFLEPFVGRHSVLILHGDEHLRQRRLMLPPFHGEALKRWTGTIAEITHAELDTWVPGAPLKTLPRMQAMTLEVIQRVIFGSRDPELRDALRRRAGHDRLDAEPDRDVAASARTGAFTRRGRAHRRARSTRASTRPGDGDSILDLLKASGATREELRDQLVTLLAAGHETTATALAWALRAARPPPDATRRPTSRSTRSSRRSCAPAPCSRSPPAGRCSRTRSAATRFRQASTSPPACISAHSPRRPTRRP